MASDPLDSDIVWLTVPDDAIAGVARCAVEAQDWKGKFVFHSSGALTSDELAPLRKQGARVASVHPMMTFVRGAAPEMAGVSFAVEGDAAAVRVARRSWKTSARTHSLSQKQNKVLYHAFGSFCVATGDCPAGFDGRGAMAAGIRTADIKPIMTPLLWQTLRNYLKKDAASAFSGPLVRGDVATIKRHLAELKQLPEVRQVYVALAKSSLRHLPVKNRKLIERELGR